VSRAKARARPRAVPSQDLTVARPEAREFVVGYDELGAVAGRAEVLSRAASDLLAELAAQHSRIGRRLHGTDLDDRVRNAVADTELLCEQVTALRADIGYCLSHGVPPSDRLIRVLTDTAH
jgi:hypothetical protein